MVADLTAGEDRADRPRGGPGPRATGEYVVRVTVKAPASTRSSGVP